MNVHTELAQRQPRALPVSRRLQASQADSWELFSEGFAGGAKIPLRYCQLASVKLVACWIDVNKARTSGSDWKLFLSPAFARLNADTTCVANILPTRLGDTIESKWRKPPASPGATKIVARVRISVPLRHGQTKLRSDCLYPTHINNRLSDNNIHGTQLADYASCARRFPDHANTEQ